MVDSVRIRRIKWLGGVLRHPATDVIRRVVLTYAKVVIRHRRQDRAAADNDAEEQAEPRVTRKGSRQARARAATIRNISVEDEIENALFAVPLRKQHVGSVILDEALPRWATEHKLLALAQDTGRWNKILKNLEQQVKQATPTRPEIDGMRTRKDITLIKDKTGTQVDLIDLAPMGGI